MCGNMPLMTSTPTTAMMTLTMMMELISSLSKRINWIQSYQYLSPSSVVRVVGIVRYLSHRNTLQSIGPWPFDLFVYGPHKKKTVQDKGVTGNREVISKETRGSGRWWNSRSIILRLPAAGCLLRATTGDTSIHTSGACEIKFIHMTGW